MLSCSCTVRNGIKKAKRWSLVSKSFNRAVLCLMSSANIPGKYSNHSLRSTSMTRLLQCMQMQMNSSSCSILGIAVPKALVTNVQVRNYSRIFLTRRESWRISIIHLSTSKESNIDKVGADPSQASTSSSAFPEQFEVNMSPGTLILQLQ